MSAGGAGGSLPTDMGGNPAASPTARPGPVLQPTPLPRPGSPQPDSSPSPSGLSDGGFQQVANREWPFVEEPPAGSAILPLDAAMQVYFVRLGEEWAWVLSERERYDDEIGRLNVLERSGALTPAQRERLTGLRVHYRGIDNVSVMVDMESRPSNAVRTVMTNLRMGIWQVTYNGGGIWHVSDGAGGMLEYSERTEEARRLR